MYSRLLKLVLIVAAVGWGVAIVGVILPWPWAVAGLNAMGAGPIPDDPMFNYWMRMAGGGFTMIGVIFAATAWDPNRYGVVLPLMAWLSIAHGIILLISGLLLKIPPFPFWADAGFCLLVGVGILFLLPRARLEKSDFADREA